MTALRNSVQSLCGYYFFYYFPPYITAVFLQIFHPTACPILILLAFFYTSLKKIKGVYLLISYVTRPLVSWVLLTRVTSWPFALTYTQGLNYAADWQYCACDFQLYIFLDTFNDSSLFSLPADSDFPSKYFTWMCFSWGQINCSSCIIAI